VSHIRLQTHNHVVQPDGCTRRQHSEQLQQLETGVILNISMTSSFQSFHGHSWMLNLWRKYKLPCQRLTRLYWQSWAFKNHDSFITTRWRPSFALRYECVSISGICHLIIGYAPLRLIESHRPLEDRGCATCQEHEPAGRTMGTPREMGFLAQGWQPAFLR